MYSTAVAHNQSTPSHALLDTESLHETVLCQLDALVQIQTDVLQAFYEGAPAKRLVRGVDRLLDAASMCFNEEEAAMDYAGRSLDREHRLTHQGIVAQITFLRDHLSGFDRGRLLVELNHLARSLNEHLSSEGAASLYLKLQTGNADASAVMPTAPVGVPSSAPMLSAGHA